MFVTVESSSPTKCGSDNVRTDLHRLNIEKIDAQQIVASAALLSVEDVRSASAIVFVDDIVSTGFTLWRAISNFTSQFPESCDKPLYFLCVVPTQSGVHFVLRKAKGAGLSLTPIYNDKWLSISVFKHPSIFLEKEKAAAKDKIQRYETVIDDYMKDPEKSYIWGFRQSKQLISFYYNTPNNTLCTFWKVTDTHVPLFRRQKQVKPKVCDLKEIKKAKDNRAYYSKIELRGNRSDGHIG